MTGFSYTTSAPDEWTRLSLESGALFGTGEWQGLLERSFGCRTIYACSKDNGFAITVFRAGPFKIGYLGFPVGGDIGGNSSESMLADILANARLPDMPVCIRMPVSAFSQEARLDLPYQSNPETVIENLQDWRIESVSKNLRRDIRKAGRSGLVVSEATDALVGDELFNMYFQTVKRHGGAVRYNAGYFRALIELAKVQPRLQVLIATQETDVAGFVVTARHGNAAYYLHGGAKPEHRRSSPSDLLLNDAIQRAQREGSQNFSLMASPPDQASLIRYKEKWGGVTRDLSTYTLALRPSYRLFKIVERIYRLIG